MTPLCTHRDLFAKCEEVAVVGVDWIEWGPQYYCTAHIQDYPDLSKTHSVAWYGQ